MELLLSDKLETSVCTFESLAFSVSRLGNFIKILDTFALGTKVAEIIGTQFELWNLKLLWLLFGQLLEKLGIPASGHTVVISTQMDGEWNSHVNKARLKDLLLSTYIEGNWNKIRTKVKWTFVKLAISGLFFVYFPSFQTKSIFFTTNDCEKCHVHPICIRRWDLNLNFSNMNNLS